MRAFLAGIRAEDNYRARLRRKLWGTVFIDTLNARFEGRTRALAQALLPLTKSVGDLTRRLEASLTGKQERIRERRPQPEGG